MYTAAALKTQTVRDLGKLASKLGVEGWRSMRKDELVRALVRAAKRRAANQRASKQPVAKRRAAVRPAKAPASKAPTSKAPTSKAPTSKANASKANASKANSVKSSSKTAVSRLSGASSSRKKPVAPKPKKSNNSNSGAAKPKNPRAVRRIQKANQERERYKNLAGAENGAANGNGRKHDKPAKPVKPAAQVKQEALATMDGKKDRIILLVRDAYWLQAMWELTRPSVERAKAAMAEHWHTAKPVIRLIELDSGGTTSSAERVAREIEVHGGVRTWYIDVQNSPRSFRVDIGYLAANGKFFTLARSNTVTTPRPGSGDDLNQNWSEIAEDCEKIYALSGGYSDDSGTHELQELFEERLGRPMGSQVGSRFGVGADKMLTQQRSFEFEVDAEMIIYGVTKPNAHITLAGTPVKLRSDGSFSARLSLPDRRQVLPVVASSPDGVEQRTVVLAVERNTKVMEPRIREGDQ